MSVNQYTLSEVPVLIAPLDTGDSVTVTIYNKSDGTVIPLDSNSATEIGSTGLFRYTVDFTTPPTSGYNYYVAQFVGALQKRAVEFHWSQIDPILTFLNDIHGGGWEIVGNQQIFTKSDNSTIVATFNLVDVNGTPASRNVFKRTRV